MYQWQYRRIRLPREGRGPSQAERTMMGLLPGGNPIGGYGTFKVLFIMPSETVFIKKYIILLLLHTKKKKKKCTLIHIFHTDIPHFTFYIFLLTGSSGTCMDILFYCVNRNIITDTHLIHQHVTFKKMYFQVNP